MRARQTGGQFDPGEGTLTALLGLLAPGDEDALREAAGAIAGWDGVCAATIEVHPVRAGGGPLVVAAGARPRLRPPAASLVASYDLVDRGCAIGRLKVTLEAGADERALRAACQVAAVMVTAAAARWRMESALLEARSYQAVGQIAAGLVHDFNNLLTAISGNATVAHALAAPGDRVLMPIERIEDAARSASSLARALLNFVRGSSHCEPLSLNEVAGDTARVLSRAVRDGVVVTLDLRDGVPWVEGERALLQQALVNLVLNAEQAILDGGHDDGMVTITTRRVDRLPDGVEGGARAARCYAALSVSDTGPGIPPEAAERVFQPFFTTKGNAGTGLGLASVAQVVRRHGGAVGLDSRPGEGATFTLYLPVPEGGAAADGGAVAHAPRIEVSLVGQPGEAGEAGDIGDRRPGGA